MDNTRETLETFIAMARESMSVAFRMPMAKIQRQSTIDRGVKGPRWVSRTTFPSPPEDDIRTVVLDAIKELGDGLEQYDMPSIAPVPVQWTGFRSGVSKDAPEPPGMTEHAKYQALVGETSSDMTLMYTYGGAHYMNGPHVRRPVASGLCQLTGARAIIVQHRLAPQSPFPSQLLDVLEAYLSLLYPPPGSFHTPVDPKNLVLVADSTGSQLALGIVQVLLAARKTRGSAPTIQFHGRSVPLALPAGVAMQSPSLGGCLPSWEGNAATDILPVDVPYHKPDFPQDSLWPTSPPREDPYTYLPTYMNPLVNTMMAVRWEGSPPMYISIGSQEMQQDPVRVVAQTAARQGVQVIWDEYESMPHNWPMLLPTWPQSIQCMQKWAQACTTFATKANIATKGSFLSFEPDETGKRASSAVDVLQLTDITAQDVQRAMAQGILDTRAGAADFIAKARAKSKL